MYEDNVATADHFLSAPQVEATGEAPPAAVVLEKEKEKEVKDMRIKVSRSSLFTKKAT